MYEMLEDSLMLALQTWEYGTAWGSYRLAASKTMECSQNGATWSCTTQARPCKRR